MGSCRDLGEIDVVGGSRSILKTGFSGDVRPQERPIRVPPMEVTSKSGTSGGGVIITGGGAGGGHPLVVGDEAVEGMNAATGYGGVGK